MNLRQVVVAAVAARDEARFQQLMQAHHYLGPLPKIGQTLWYVARWCGDWVALVSFSSPALKCRPRDEWIGWDFRHKYDRLHLISNNSRFLILPGNHYPNLASRILSLCERRLVRDWPQRFGHPLLLLETFVDPSRFRGTIYQAANWLALGQTLGFRRTRGGYSQFPATPKQVFIRPLVPRARAWLSQPVLDPRHRHGVPKIMLSADHMRSLPEFFADIEDPRRGQGRRHPLPAVLAIAAAATLCGMRGYRAIAQWAGVLGHNARARFRCRYRNRVYEIPSESIIRNVLIRVDPDALDRALQRWNAVHGATDEALAIDGKTLTADALLTQRKLARHLLERQAHYLFAVKANQPNLLADLQLAFTPRGEPDFRENLTLAHGRLERRAIWTSIACNDYLDFPGIGQAFVIEREVVHKKTATRSLETAYGITSHAPHSADPARVLALNRNHRAIENGCHYVLDWNWDEDRCRIHSAKRRGARTN